MVREILELMNTELILDILSISASQLGWRQYSISNKSKEVVFLFIVLAWHEVGGTEKWPNIFNPSSFPS